MTHPQTSDEWDERYLERERLWSGKPNAVLTQLAEKLGAGGTALDVGCGEGADALWLASRGWAVTGIDLSAVAIERARASGAVQNLNAKFYVTDAIDFAKAAPQPFDLVTAFFLHSRDEDQRAATMAVLPTLVRPGGKLLVVSHAAMPPWSRHHHHDDGSPRPTFDITPESEIAALGLGEDWKIDVAEEIERPVTDPDGEGAHLRDAVVLARR
ncbi:MAG TPA: methyltransferase domain-containing protein [Actinomycetales bacterium]|nr:methyltransferase domain-containing protein [Actinomycetales bacterium]